MPILRRWALRACIFLVPLTAILLVGCPSDSETDPVVEQTNGSDAVPDSTDNTGASAGSPDVTDVHVEIPAEDLSQTLDVLSFYGTYDASQKDISGAARSLNGPIEEQWPAPPQPDENYSIGVLFPHLKDPYWLSAPTSSNS